MCIRDSVGKGQGVAAGQEHVADIRIGRDVVQSAFPLGRVDKALMLAAENAGARAVAAVCLLYTSPSPRDRTRSRMPSSA